MRRLLWIVCGLGLALPACAIAAGGPISPQQGGAGASAPGGDLTYIAVGAGHRTVIESVRRAGGAVDRFTILRGSLGIPGVASDGSATGLSADGRTLVLSGGVGRYPIVRTHLVVLDARHLRTRARITLPGWFNVDAISPTGRWLYLIHYPSARDTNRYEVRAYDLVDRRLVAKPVIDPREPDEAMQGFPMTRAMSADGRWAYTLYDRGGEAPFIHALDTEGRTAACIDLPGLTGADISGMRLVVGRGGATLSVVGRHGPVALVDTRTRAVVPPAVARPPASAASAAAPAHGDGPWARVALALGGGGRAGRGALARRAAALGACHPPPRGVLAVLAPLGLGRACLRAGALLGLLAVLVRHAGGPGRLRCRPMARHAPCAVARVAHDGEPDPAQEDQAGAEDQHLLPGLQAAVAGRAGGVRRRGGLGLGLGRAQRRRLLGAGGCREDQREHQGREGQRRLQTDRHGRRV